MAKKKTAPDGFVNYIVDIDAFIELYNKKNPLQKDQINRDTARQMLGISYAIPLKWKKGEIPEAINVIMNMKRLAECSLEDFIKPKEDVVEQPG